MIQGIGTVLVALILLGMATCAFSALFMGENNERE
jgi:hypothetical protein